MSLSFYLQHSLAMIRFQAYGLYSYSYIWIKLLLAVLSTYDANHCAENRRRCSQHKRGRSVARGRMVHDLVQGSGSLLDGPNGSRL
jgi:hypothetical protein